MKIILSENDRLTLMILGFPRQTIYKWIHRGIIPRPGNRAFIVDQLGRDPWEKNKRKNSGKSGIPGNPKARKEN